MNNDAKTKAFPKWFWLALPLALAVTVVFYQRRREDTLGPTLSTKVSFRGQLYDLTAIGIDTNESTVSPRVVLSSGISGWGMYLKDSQVFFYVVPLSPNPDELPVQHFPVTATLSLCDGTTLKPVATGLSAKEAVAALMGGKSMN